MGVLSFSVVKKPGPFVNDRNLLVKLQSGQILLIIFCGDFQIFQLGMSLCIVDLLLVKLFVDLLHSVLNFFCLFPDLFSLSFDSFEMIFYYSRAVCGVGLGQQFMLARLVAQFLKNQPGITTIL